MKIINISTIIFTLVFLFIISGCKDLLELPSDGRITMDDVFNDYNRTRGYLNSCYGYCPAPYMDRSSYTDEAQDADDITPGSRYSIWYDGNITPTNFSSYSADGSPWGQLYEGIRKCNVFLANIEDATVFASEEEKEGWKAQARTLRALYYLQLIKRYGAVPIIEEPLPIDYNFSIDDRSTFSEVVQFIVADCDRALEAPDTREGFPWEVYENQFQIMTRAVAYAIKSQAVTYAASELWSDGTYDWNDATEVNLEALTQCLNNDYELFSEEPDPDFAQNAYALYFLTSSNDQRSVDKETIYQVGGQMEVWKFAGLPTTPGMEKAGPCPTQGLIDSYEMANGETPITGYSDESNLEPIINTSSGYDPANPYEGRDPRFYASIYYNGAPRNLSESRDDEYSQELQTQTANQLSVTEEDDFYDIVTTGGDPYIFFSELEEGLEDPPSTTLTFQYKSATALSGLQIFFGPALAENRSIRPEDIPASQDWQEYTLDITSPVGDFDWGNPGDFLRVDFGGMAGIQFQIRNISINVKSIASTIETYVDGAEGISMLNRKHTRTGYYLRKFNNYRSGLNNNADGSIRLLRLGELYLNFAESAYQSDGPDAVLEKNGISLSARDAVNAVRARVGMPGFPEGMNIDEFEKKYRNERRIELAFEEHRYFDVRRWNVLSETDKFVTGMRIENTGSSFTFNRFKFPDRHCVSDKYLRYPIDQAEVNKMLGHTGDSWQNPGW